MGGIETSQESRFQFTLPCRERLGGLLFEGADDLFQFTLPCRERLEEAGERACYNYVSIHAPV